MSNQKNSVFSTLSSVAIKDKVERKGNIDYLSWAYAWSLLKQHYPTAQRVVYEDPATGWNYFSDGRTAWVKVGVIVEEQEHIDYLPVMDFKNNSIPIAKVTSTDVTKSIQRSTAKAIAMHGLGLSLWTGEDVPEMVTESAKKPAPQTEELTELKKGTENWDKVVAYVTANKEIGIEKIGQQLSRKYKMSPAIKKDIMAIINQ